MCCSCCAGRIIWVSAKRVFEDGCPALQTQARQTLGLHSGNGSCPQVGDDVVDDDFWMNDEEEELESP